MGIELATRIGTHSVLNQAIFEAPLIAKTGPLQVSATAFVKSIVIEATPLMTTISPGSATIKPSEIEKPPTVTAPSLPPEDFQKPDDFITDTQCPVGTSLIDGKCTPQTLQEQPLAIQFAVILLLVLLAIGLVFAIEMKRRKARKIIASELLLSLIHI